MSLMKWSLKLKQLWQRLLEVLALPQRRRPRSAHGTRRASFKAMTRLRLM